MGSKLSIPARTSSGVHSEAESTEYTSDFCDVRPRGPPSPVPIDKIQCHGPRVATTTRNRLVKSHPVKEFMDSLATSAENGFTLLQDAKLYTLAQYLQLSDLKRLAFHNMQDVLRSLNSLPPDTTLVTKIVSLIQYTYAHTDSLASSEEPLRKLVSTFVASKLALLSGPKFDSLMAEGGDFAVDVMSQTRREVTYQLWKREKDNGALEKRVRTLKRKVEELERSESDTDSDGAVL